MCVYCLMVTVASSIWQQAGHSVSLPIWQQTESAGPACTGQILWWLWHPGCRARVYRCGRGSRYRSTCRLASLLHVRYQPPHSPWPYSFFVLSVVHTFCLSLHSAIIGLWGGQTTNLSHYLPPSLPWLYQAPASFPLYPPSPQNLLSARVVHFRNRVLIATVGFHENNNKSSSDSPSGHGKASSVIFISLPAYFFLPSIANFSHLKYSIFCPDV